MSSLSRRELLAAGAAAGAAASWGAVPGWARRREPLARAGEFAEGVGAALPGRTSIGLWTRLEAERSSRVRLEIATDPGFRRVVRRQEVRAAALRDFTAHARVTGLKPGTRYWYRFETRSTESPVGRFRTLLPADSREPLRIGFFSCQDWQAGYYTAHAGLAQEPDLDLILSLGDYIYERNFYEGPRTDTLGANKDGEVQTLDEYRSKYRLYRSDANLRAMHRSAAYVPIWDDHEVEDNWAAGKPGEATQDPRVGFPQRRRNGFDAFFEYHPVPRIRADRDRIYRAMRMGIADVVMTDQRQYRDDQPCGDAFVVPCPSASAPGRTMLGGTQKRWLIDTLSSSRAPWKLVASQLMWMSLDFPAGSNALNDAWDGYAAERREILEALKARGVSDVAFLTGDIHTFFAGTVTTTGRTGGTPVGTEFVGGSITSLGVPETVGGAAGLPLTGENSSTLTDQLRLMNPHYAFIDTERRGYGVAEVRPDELRVTFRAPATTAAPESPVSTLAEMRVARGGTAVEVR